MWTWKSPKNWLYWHKSADSSCGGCWPKRLPAALGLTSPGQLLTKREYKTLRLHRKIQKYAAQKGSTKKINIYHFHSPIFTIFTIFNTHLLYVYPICVFCKTPIPNPHKISLRKLGCMLCIAYINVNKASNRSIAHLSFPFLFA